MEIQQLQVKISAEMSGVQRALLGLKRGFESVRQNANSVENRINALGKNANSSFNAMGDNAANAFVKANEAVAALSAAVTKAAQDAQKAWDVKIIDYDKIEKGKPALNLDQVRKDLEEQQELLTKLFERADKLKEKITIETDGAQLLSLYNQLDNVNQEIEKAEININNFQTQLKGFETMAGKAFITPEIQQMQEQVQNLSFALQQAQSELAVQRHIDFGSEATELASQKVAALAEQYEEATDKLHTMVDAAQKAGQKQQEAAQEAGQAQQKAAQIGTTGWEKAANVIGQVAGTVANIGQTMAKIVVPAAKGVKNAFVGVSKAMLKLNPVPKLLGKISNSLHSIWRRVKTAFIFSVINSWFHNFRDRVSNYLKTNQELQSALSSLKGTFLTAFQPIYEAIIPAIIKLINWLSTAINTLAKFIALISGKSVAQMQANAQALYEQANGYEAAGGAAEDAAKTIAAFDELNVLNGPKGGGGSGSGDGSGIVFPEMEEPEALGSWGEVFSNILDKLLAKIPTFNETLEGMAEKINNFSANLLGAFDFPGVDEKLMQLGTGLAASFNNMWETIDWTQLGASIGATIDGLFNFALGYIRERDWGNIGSSLAEFINGAVEEINWENVGELLVSGWNIVWQTFNGFVSDLDWTELGSSISTAFQSALENLDFESFVSSVSGVTVGITKMLATFVSQTDWRQVGKALVDGMCKFIETMDWGELMQALATLGAAILEASFQLGFGILEAAWKGLVSAIDQIGAFFNSEIERAGGNIAKGILNGIMEIFINILDWLYYNVFKPFIDAFCRLFGIHSPSKVMEEQGEYIAEGLLNGISEKWQDVIQWISEAFEEFKRLCEETWENIKQKASEKWESIKTTIATSWDSIRSSVGQKVNEVKTTVVTAWTDLKGKTVSAFNTIKTTAGSIWGKISLTVTTWADNIGSKVGTAFNTLKEGAVSIFNSMKEAIKVPLNAIIGFINGLISGVVSGINGMIGALNKIHFRVDDWVPLIGGKSFGFNIGYVTAPQIPLLANGGVITDPTLAMMGEYAGAQNNPEIVAPQDLLRETVISANGEMVNALYQIAQQIIATIEDVDMDVTIGDDVIAQAAKRGADNYRRRTGRMMFA